MEPPVCPVCAHPHHRVDVCPTCGHSGKIVGFPGPQDRHPPPATFHLVPYELGATPSAEHAGYAMLARLLRRRVFLHELRLGHLGRGPTGAPVPPGFPMPPAELCDLDDYEATARHALGFIGDAPVAYARWRPVPLSAIAPNATAAAGGGVRAALLVDRLAVLKEYRGRGYGCALLQAALLDALSSAAPGGLPPGVVLDRVSLFIPAAPDYVSSAKAALSAGYKPVGAEPRQEDPTGMFRAPLAGGLEGSGPHAPTVPVPVWEFAVAADALAAAGERARERVTPMLIARPPASGVSA